MRLSEGEVLGWIWWWWWGAGGRGIPPEGRLLLAGSVKEEVTPEPLPGMAGCTGSPEEANFSGACSSRPASGHR